MIGLYFGSFNPIHVGHLIIANFMVQQPNLDEVWMVVSPHNPHKEKSSLLADHHRLRLVQEAVEDFPSLKASDIEFNLPQPSYTIDTLTYLTEKYPNKEFALLMGEDNLRTLHKWKNYELLLRNFPVFVYPRVLTEQEINLKSDFKITVNHPNITKVEAPVMQISSSAIRRLIKNGGDASFMLTEAVKRYVDEMNFYR